MSNKARELQRVMKATYHDRRLSRGQSAVELALIASVFLLVLFGIIQLSRAVYSYNLVSYAARDATRYAIVHGSDSITPATSAAVKNFVLNESNGVDASQFTVATTWTPNNSPSSTVKVVVTYNFALSIPFFGSVTLPLSSTSQMVISQ